MKLLFWLLMLIVSAVFAVRSDGTPASIGVVAAIVSGLAVLQQLVAIVLRRIAADGHDTGDFHGNMAQSLQLLENEQLEWVERTAEEMAALPGIDISWCDSREAELVEAGFRRLGHVESLAATRQFPSMRSIVRVMNRADGSSAAVYDVKIRGLFRVFVLLRVIPGHIRTVEIETEFDDGTLLVTNNCAQANLMDAPPQIDRAQFPSDTTVEELLEDHDQRLADRLAEDASVAIHSVRTLRDGIFAQQRLDALKAAWRKRAGPMTEAEAERFTDGDGSADELRRSVRAASSRN